MHELREFTGLLIEHAIAVNDLLDIIETSGKIAAPEGTHA